MIKDMPSNNNFKDEGRVLLNLAFNQLQEINNAVDLYLEGKQFVDESEFEPDIHLTEEKFLSDQKDWKAELVEMHETLIRSVNRPLGVCMTLIAQAAEFFLKSKIATISPYLLIENERSNWSGKDREFSDLKTINSSSLIRVYHSVCENDQRLPPKTVQKFETLRKRRNKLIHSVVASSIPPDEVCSSTLDEILFICYALCDESWRDVRFWFLDNYDTKNLFSDTPETLKRLGTEMEMLLEYLEPKSSKLYLNFSPKTGRNYICPNCYKHRDTKIRKYPYETASMFGKLTGEQVFCFVCDKSHDIERDKCQGFDCLGDVLFRGNSSFSTFCLTCTFRTNVELT